MNEFTNVLKTLNCSLCGEESEIHTISDEFRRLARFHGVAPSIKGAELHELHIRNQKQALRNLSHLKKLNELFTECKVPMLCVKGIPLAIRVFGDVGKRHTGDIDLWVGEDDLEKTFQVLAESGHHSKTEYFELSDHFKKKYREKKFHIGFTHEATGVSVEIHWRLGATQELFPISFEDAWARRVSVVSGSIEIPTLDDSYHLLFLYIHAARHLWERLFWIVDIVGYHKLPDSPSPSEILKRATDYGIDRAIVTTWKIATEFLDFDPKVAIKHDPVASKIAKWGAEHLSRSERGINTGQAILSGMLLNRTIPHKLKILSEYATAADDWHRVRVPDGFGWIYVLIRPWFLIKRKFLRTDRA